MPRGVKLTPKEFKWKFLQFMTLESEIFLSSNWVKYTTPEEITALLCKLSEKESESDLLWENTSSDFCIND